MTDICDVWELGVEKDGVTIFCPRERDDATIVHYICAVVWYFYYRLSSLHNIIITYFMLEKNL